MEKDLFNGSKMNEPIKPHPPAEGPKPVPTHPSQKPGDFPSTQPHNDPWAEMLSSLGATPQDVEKFKMNMMHSIDVQMSHERERAVKAIRRMRTGED